MNKPSPDQTTPLPIIIYSDVICPWCYIGKRRFEAALDSLRHSKGVAITWRPFELNPDMPEEGMDRAAYRARKFGPAKSAELDRQMQQTGDEVGITFAFDRMKRTPNTRLAHRLIWWAGGISPQAQNAIVNRLFMAYFEEGQDIGQRDVLIELARDAGLDGIGAGVALDEEASLDAVLDLEDQGINMGIRGVPFFVLINKYAISGAQPPELWRDALPKIAEEFAEGSA